MVHALSMIETESMNVKTLSEVMEASHRNMQSRGGLKDVIVISPADHGSGIYKATVIYKEGKVEDEGYIRIKSDGRGRWKIERLR